MTEDAKTVRTAPSAGTEHVHRRTLHASRAATPRACGCGLPVAFDPGRQEFFCIGCGSSKLCACRRTLLGSAGRPVNVA